MNESTHLFVGELLGTMMLILFGDGVVAGVLLKRSKAESSGWIVITAGWAFAVMCGIFVARAFGGTGALNPVAPLIALVFNKADPMQMSLAIAGEFVGAFIGAVLVFLHYGPHWRETHDSGTKLSVFCTGPAIRRPISNFISEFIGTFVLVFVAESILAGKIAPGFDPAYIGMVVWAIGLSLGGTTGYAINPARDFSPRLAHTILPIPGKGTSDWGYAWIPIFGPIAGGLAAGGLFKLLT